MKVSSISISDISIIVLCLLATIFISCDNDDIGNISFEREEIKIYIIDKHKFN